MWRIEYDPHEQVLTLALAKQVGPPEMRELGRAHAKALEATGSQEFSVLLDLRGLYPLDGPSAEMLSDMKRVAAGVPGYLRRAVLVDSATIAMQQRNATLEDGGDPSELITWELEAAQRHVDRRR